MLDFRLTRHVEHLIWRCWTCSELLNPQLLASQFPFDIGVVCCLMGSRRPDFQVHSCRDCAVHVLFFITWPSEVEKISGEKSEA